MSKSIYTCTTKYKFIVPEKKYSPSVIDLNSQIARRFRQRGARALKARTSNSWRQFLKVTQMEGSDGIVFQSKYETINKALRKLARKGGYVTTTRVMMSRVHSFLRSEIPNTTNPDELLAKTSDEELRQMIQDWGDLEKARGLFKRTCNDYMKAMVWFAQVNGKFAGQEIDDVIDYFSLHRRERKTFVYMPTNEEIHKIAENGGGAELYKRKYKAAMLGVPSCGFRISTFLALLWRDVLGDPKTTAFKTQGLFFTNELDNPEIKCIMVPCYPEMKKVHPEACKNNIPYVSFLSTYATEALREHRAYHELFFGQPVNPDEPIFCSDLKVGNKIYHTAKHVNKSSFQRMLKKAAKRASLDNWQNVKPHESLRDAFDTILHSRRADGTIMSEDDREYLMGHVLSGSKDAYYNIQWLERLREEYMKLDFSPSPTVGQPVEKVIARYEKRIEELEKRLEDVEGKNNKGEAETMEDEMLKRVKKIIKKTKI